MPVVGMCSSKRQDNTQLFLLLLLMMPRQLSAYAQEQIVSLWQHGKTSASIVRELSQDSVFTMSLTVRHRIFAWRKGESLQDHQRSGQLSSITKEIADFMERMLEEDDELTSFNFHRIIVRKFGARIPASTIRLFLRQKLQWVVVRARTGPMIRRRPFQEIFNLPLVLPRSKSGHNKCTYCDVCAIEEEMLYIHSVPLPLARAFQPLHQDFVLSLSHHCALSRSETTLLIYRNRLCMSSQHTWRSYVH